jgi:hypothetical protein
MKIYIDGVEVVCDSDLTIQQEFKNTSSVVLNNVYPKSWEIDHDYTSRFYFPPSYSICTIYNEEDDLLFSGIVKNTGTIELNPRYPHYCSIQVVDFSTFLSEGKTLDFVIADMTIREAINRVVDEISGYNFQVGTIDLDSADDLIGAYSTLDKTAYDVFEYISDITGCRWFTRIVDETTVEINFIDADKLTPGTSIQYTQQFFEDYLINDINFSYGTYDYRNKQIMTSDNVSANINQTETFITNPYTTDFSLGQNVSSISLITLNGVEQDFATNSEKEIGITANFYYTPGSNTITSSRSLASGQSLLITYTPLIRGREVIINGNEVNRVSTSTQTIGTISRYENRNDSATSEELQAIGQSYIKYKGVPEITLNIECRALNWNVGQTVFFNAPLPELATNYLVKKLSINYLRNSGEIFYTYELNSAFNDEDAINYFDNQRYKNNGNIEEGKYINRDIDIENSANLIFYDTIIQRERP